MNLDDVEKIANAILYEGYLLYPYRQSAFKNKRRWDFGLVYPPGREKDNEPSSLKCECLVMATAESSIEACIRFLHPYLTRDEEGQWLEATERTVSLPPTKLSSCSHHLSMDLQFQAESHGQRTISGQVELSAEGLDSGLFRVGLLIRNTTPAECCDGRLEGTLYRWASTHAILSVDSGRFVSLLEPPDAFRAHAAACHNVGLFPVLAGDRNSASMMLASPIILYDYPEVAFESGGNLFDGTEIDELLNLRIQALSDGEKAEIRRGDPRGAYVLKTSESLTSQDFLRLHATMHKLPKNGGL
jgi:hypothetical protein